MEMMVKPICLAPRSAAAKGSSPSSTKRHVLGHHDGVVHDEARRDGGGHQGQAVEAVADQVHHPEGGQERERHGDAGDDRRPPVAEEQEDDQHHQGDAEQEGELDVMHRGPDGLRPVEADADVDPRRDRAAQRGEELGHPVDGLDDVGARRAPDHEHHRALSVDPAGDAVVLHVVDHPGHVAEAHGGAALVGDDDVAVPGGAEDLIVGRDAARLRGPADAALGLVDGGVRERRAHVLEAEPEAGEQGRVRLHAHRGLGPSADRHLAHALDLGGSSGR